MTTITETYESAYACGTIVTIEYDGEERDETIARTGTEAFPCPECGRAHNFRLIETEDEAGGSDASGDDSSDSSSDLEEAAPDLEEDDDEAPPEDLEDLFDDDVVEGAAWTVNPSEHTVPELRDELAEGDYGADALMAAYEAEADGEQRTTALGEIETALDAALEAEDEG